MCRIREDKKKTMLVAEDECDAMLVWVELKWKSDRQSVL